MRSELAQRSVQIPEEVKVEVKGRKITVTGPKGSLTRDLSHVPLSFRLEKDAVSVTAHWPRKKEQAMVGTAAAIINNMITGVTKGYTYKLKTVYAHFPVTMKVQEKERKMIIENFIGEKTARTVRLLPEVKVTVSGDEILVKGIDLERVSQTAADIEAATKIKQKDQRVFLDGIYVYEKAPGM